jgi:hypothetical protein
MTNDKQTEHLDQFPNSFEALNHVQWFNHTMQLGAKALLKPFNADETNTDNIDVPAASGPVEDKTYNDDMDDNDLDTEGGEAEEDEGSDNNVDNDIDDNDPLELLDAVAHEDLMEATLAVQLTLNKVHIK